jgi:hypothetical protein
MNRFNFLALIALISSFPDAHAIKCKSGENYVSRFDSNKQLSEEEIEGGFEHLDVLSHYEIVIDDDKYIIDKNLVLYKNLTERKNKIVQFNAQFDGDNTTISFFRHGEYHFFEIDFNDYIQGYISKIHIVDLKNKKIVSEFHKCANQNDSFILKDSALIYMCNHYCKKNKYYIFDSKKGQFIAIEKKHNCQEIASPNKKENFNILNFKIRYKKDKNGIEYKSTRLPLVDKNCK